MTIKKKILSELVNLNFKRSFLNRCFSFFSLETFEAIGIRISRAYTIWSGLGMSIQGVRTCGDYMFSGHTVALTTLNFFITECKYWNGLLYSIVEKNLYLLLSIDKQAMPHASELA